MEVQIRRYKYPNETMLIDEEDIALLKGRKPTYHQSNSNAYIRVKLSKDGKAITLSRLIMNCPDGMEVDHINGNTLDNRRCNLRVVEPRMNHYNNHKRRYYNGNPTKSKYKGIYKQKNKWRSTIVCDNRVIRLGYHHTEEQAARAYDEAAKKYHGEYACLNFPNG